MDAFAPRIASADVLLVQLEIPLETALHALDVGRAAGVRTILNPAPAPAGPIAAAADYLTPNETEAASLGDADGTLVVTLGLHGASLRGEEIPAFPAEPVDTTGAGDAFCAAFAVALAEGADDAEAVRWGCAAGAHMVEHEGVHSGPADPWRTGGTPGAGMTRLIVDTDTAGDDVFSLLIALRHPPAGWRRSPSAAGTSPSSRRSRTRSTPWRWPAGPARCRSTRAAPSR